MSVNVGDREELLEYLKKHGVAYNDYDSLEDLKQRYYQDCISKTSMFEEESTSDIEEMDLEQLSDYFEKHNVDFEHLETLEEMQKLYKKVKQRIEVNRRSFTEKTPPVEKAMTEIIEIDRRMRKELSSTYKMTITFLENRDAAVEFIKSVLREKYGDYWKLLDSFTKELDEDECPIIVAGETSAGKSSLLNLILGTDVLAHSLLGTTSTICRLHNSDRKRFITTSYKDQTHKVPDDQLNKETFAEYLTSRDEQGKPKYKQVDLYWPIAVLQDHVTIVDTPGIGENDPLTMTLLEYLPKAVAFIYVINSANSGGLQDDYLLKILNQRKMEWAMEDGLSIDYETTIFVCNKWDIVRQVGEEEKVWDYTVETIARHLPGFPEKHIFQLSTTEAERCQKSGLDVPENFSKLMVAIEKLVASSMKGKTTKYFNWIEKFLGTILSSIMSRINNARRSEEDKHKMREDVQKRLNKLKTDADKVREKLLSSAKHECVDMAENLFKHVSKPEVRREILTWKNEDVPDIEANDLDVTKFRAEERIKARISAVLKRWEKQSKFVVKISDKLRSEFRSECQLLEQQCKEVNLIVEGPSDKWMLTSEKGKTQYDDNQAIFSTGEKVALAVMAPLWVPLVTAAAILFIPVGVGMTIKERLKERRERENFMKDKSGYMRQWAKKIIDEAFAKENIEKFIQKVYYDVFEKKITQICSDFIPRQIAADQRKIAEIVNDMRSASLILNEFQPLLRAVRTVTAKLRLFELDFLDVGTTCISTEAITRGKMIGQGNFSKIYEAKWKTPSNEEKNVALKIFRTKLAGACLLCQLDEVECLRKIQHTNVVELYGVCLSSTDDKEERQLTMVIELCDGSLEDKVFKNEELQCRKYRDAEEREEAFAFFLKMAIGVCDGLAAMHDNEYLHRDLKLSNVLVKNDTAKLCDLGFAKAELLMTGTFAGTMTHMSPEILKFERYTFSSDVYSLGILLWELWYGRHAYSEEEYAAFPPNVLIDAIKTGRRPKMSYKFEPPVEIQELVMKCWDGDPNKRPTPSDVGADLRKIQTNLKSRSMRFMTPC